MKMMYNGTPIKSLNIKHFEVSTNDATLKASDMQSGITAYAKGKKVTGTGKSFSFAMYGKVPTNLKMPIPDIINVVYIASVDYPIKHQIDFANMVYTDFSGSNAVAKVVISNIEYPINLVIENDMISFDCEEEINLEVFYGKDEYI